MRKLAILAFVILTGCATAQGPAYDAKSIPSIKKGGAQMVFFRPSAFTSSAVNAKASVDGISCSIPQRGYSVVDIHPGEKQITISSFGNTSDGTKTIFASEGKRYFVKISPNTGRAMAAGGLGLVGLLGHGAVTHGTENSGDWIAQVIDAQNAQSELGQTRHVPCLQK